MQNAVEKALHRQMYPLVEASGGHEQYYVRSLWHSETCNWECSGQSDVPPSRGIWWSRAVLCKVSLTFTCMHPVTLTFEDADVPPVEASGGQEQYYKGQLDIYIHASGQLDIQLTWALLCSPGNRNSAKCTNLWQFIFMLFHRKHLCHSDEPNPPDTSSRSTPGKWHKSPMQPFINIWFYFQLLFTVVYLHHLITYSSTKCMQMLEGLFQL